MTDNSTRLPDGLIAYGPLSNCTLALCKVEWSVYHYRPSLGANGAFIGLFGVCMIIHIAQGIKWKTWWFTSCMILGCISEMIGYGGRIMLYSNPFNFTAFLMQIICITLSPVFFTAAIYFTLSRIVLYLGVEYSRFRPQLFYYIFLPCDIVSLVLQAAGGALSSTTSGASQAGVDIALTGLSYQVLTLLVFIGLVADYALRYKKAVGHAHLNTKFKTFAGFMSLAIILILIRCAYRIAELRQGYSGSLIHDEGLFIALEGVMVIVASFFLNIGHPGLVFVSGDSSTPKTPASAEVQEPTYVNNTDEPKAYN